MVERLSLTDWIPRCNSFLSAFLNLFQENGNHYKLCCPWQFITLLVAKKVQVLRKLKIGISYNDVIDLLSTWAQKEYVKNVQNSRGPKPCPNNITKGVPAVTIVDNDDFMEDCLTGGDTSHYKNLLMTQLNMLTRIHNRNFLQHQKMIPNI